MLDFVALASNKCPTLTNLRSEPQSLVAPAPTPKPKALQDNVLGTGKFSTVYMCTYRENPDQRYALKAV